MSGAMFFGIINLTTSIFMFFYSIKHHIKSVNEPFKKILSLITYISVVASILHMISISKLIQFHTAGAYFVAWEFLDFLMLSVIVRLIGMTK